MRINPISTIALVGSLAVYANAILQRGSISGPIDPRVDVLVIAAIGILAHFAFERTAKTDQ